MEIKKKHYVCSSQICVHSFPEQKHFLCTSILQSGTFSNYYSKILEICLFLLGLVHSIFKVFGTLFIIVVIFRHNINTNNWDTF